MTVTQEMTREGVLDRGDAGPHTSKVIHVENQTFLNPVESSHLLMQSEAGNSSTRFGVRSIIYLLTWLMILQFCTAAVVEIEDMGKLRVKKFLLLGNAYPDSGAVAVDIRNNYVVVSSWSRPPGSPTHPGAPPATRERWDGLVKYDAQLNYLWTQKISTPRRLQVAVRGADEIFVGGEFEKTLQIGGQSLKSFGGVNSFIGKFTGEGKVVWLQGLGGASDQLSSVIAVDGAGHSYIAGRFVSEISIGAKILTPQGKRGIYVAKFDPYGSLVWATRGGGDLTHPFGMAVDSNQNVFLTGYSDGSVTTFGDCKISTPDGVRDMFLAKFDPKGTCVWAITPGGVPGGRSGHRIAVDSLGNPHVVGLIQRTTAFGSTNFVVVDGARSPSLFAAKYGPNGEFHWVRQFRHGDFDFTGFVASDLATNVRSSSVAQVSRVPTAQLRIVKVESLPTPGRETASVTQANTPPAATPIRGLPVVQLLVERVGESLVLAWPKQFATHQLEGSFGIAPMPIWEPVPFEVQVVGDYRVVTIPLSRALGFYRLRTP